MRKRGIGIGRAWILIVGSLSLTACGADGDAPTAAEPAALTAQETYNVFCASCHETGREGAPVTGNLVDWVDRSPLWQAVLMEHANEGYLEMPAKGGHPELSDRAVSAAVEYMLTTTFPKQLPD